MNRVSGVRAACGRSHGSFRVAGRGVLVICLAAVSAGAQTNGPSSSNPSAVLEAVTLDYCVARGIAVAESNGLFTAGAARAQAGILEARARSYPHLHVRPEVRYYPADSETEPFISADLGPHFLEIPQNRLHRRIARRNVTRAMLDERRARCRRRMEVMRVYVQSLQAARKLDLAARRLEAAEQRAAAWERLSAARPGLREQQDAARAALRSARARHVQAELHDRESRRQLNALCGLKLPPTFPLKDLPPFTLPDVDVDACLEWARVQRGDLAAMRHELETMETMIRLAKMSRWPTPGLSFGYTDRGRDEFDDTDEGGVFAGLQLQVPVWDAGQTRARVERLRAGRRGLRNELAAAEATVSKSVALAFAFLQEAWAARAALAADPVPAREARRAEIEYARRQLAWIDVEQARLRLTEHETRQAVTDLDCYRALADLLEAINATRAQFEAGLNISPSGGGPP